MSASHLETAFDVNAFFTDSVRTGTLLINDRALTDVTFDPPFAAGDVTVVLTPSANMKVHALNVSLTGFSVESSFIPADPAFETIYWHAWI